MPTRREQSGWLILASVAAVALALGTRLLVTGAPGNPALVRELTGQSWQELQEAQPGVGRLVRVMARHEGLAILGWGIWLAWSSVRAYRSGRSSAWYVWWTVPVLILGIRLTGAASGGALRSLLPGLALLAVAGLFLTRSASRRTSDTTS